MKNKLYLILGLIIGLVITGVSAYESGRLYAGSIDVDTTSMSALGETSDVNAALTYLYGQAEKIATVFSNERFHYYEQPTYIAFIYLDPTNLSRECSKTEILSDSGTKDGCMKWYIYDETNTSYVAILDHSTTKDGFAWGNSKTGGPNLALEQLDNDTVNWKKGINELTVRLMTADEVAHIVGADVIIGWSSNTSTNSFSFANLKNGSVQMTRGTSKYYWLQDYSIQCINYGCNFEDTNGEYGYWTSTPSAGSTNSAWLVHGQGELTNIYSIDDTRFGIRPVIEIPKSLFE